MANRGLARLIAVQTVFSNVFVGDGLDFEELARYVSENFVVVNDKDTIDYAFKIIRGVIDNKEEIDKVLSGAVTKTSLENVYAIDLSILRCALYELLFNKDDKVPPRVVLDEYIELAKFLSNDSSRRFVNGVLASIYRNINDNDESAKDEIAGEERRIGFMVYKVVDGVVYVLMVYDRFYFWTLPKGRVMEDESVEDVIVRKAKDEVGLVVKPEDIGEKIGGTEYTYRDPDRGRVKVTVDYYVVKYGGSMDDVNIGNNKSIIDAKFFDVEELSDLRVYDDIVYVLNKGLEYINEHEFQGE